MAKKTTPDKPQKRHPGTQKGFGRKGSLADIRNQAIKSGLLPHEILLSIARGEQQVEEKLVVTYYKSGPKKGTEKHREWTQFPWFPSMKERIDCAKAAAPFYAPKLAVQAMAEGDDAKDLLAEFKKADQRAAARQAIDKTLDDED